MLSGATVSSGSGSSIVVNTPKGAAAGLGSMAASSFASINKRMQSQHPSTPTQGKTVSKLNQITFSVYNGMLVPVRTSFGLRKAF